MTARLTFWLSSAEPDKHAEAMLRRWKERANRKRCFCGRPVLPTSRCGCCCSEHDIEPQPES